MNSNFDLAFNFMIKHEGGILKDSSTGEYSNFGMTEKTLKDSGYKITDPGLLTLSDAKNLYYKLYWIPNQCQNIASQIITNKFFDMSVNMGKIQAGKLLQASLNSIGCACAIDGIIGPHTLVILNSFLLGPHGIVILENENRFLEELRIKCVTFYTDLGKKPEFVKYLPGWLARANDIGYELDRSPLRNPSDDIVEKAKPYEIQLPGVKKDV